MTASGISICSYITLLIIIGLQVIYTLLITIGLQVIYTLLIIIGLQVIYTLDEVAFVQNLIFYIETAYRTSVSYSDHAYLFDDHTPRIMVYGREEIKLTMDRLS